MFDAELESFKKIDLRSYAAAQGYQLDKRDSWRGSAVMRHPSNDDKIVIRLDAGTGHHVYFSVRDDRDNGTIIDFVQYRQRISLGAVRAVAKLLHCSKAHICNVIAGRVRGCPPIPAVSLGRRKLVRREALLAWIEQNEHAEVNGRIPASPERGRKSA